MSKTFAIAVPILRGKEEEWKKWMAEMKGKYYNDLVESRNKMGVRERTFLQHTPDGDVVVVTLEGDDPAAAFASFGRGSDEFTKRFAEGLRSIHGMDLNAPPPGPLPELVLDTHPGK